MSLKRRFGILCSSSGNIEPLTPICQVMVNRVLRDDPSKGDMHNRYAISTSSYLQVLTIICRQGLSFTAFRDCICDYHLWPVYLLGLSWLLPTVPMNAYLTLVLRDAGYGTFHTNLLTIPAYVIFILNLLFWCWLTEKLNERFLLCTVSQFWVLPLLIALETLPTTRSPWATWILSVLIYAMPYVS